MSVQLEQTCTVPVTVSVPENRFQWLLFCSRVAAKGFWRVRFRISLLHVLTILEKLRYSIVLYLLGMECTYGADCYFALGLKYLLAVVELPLSGPISCHIARLSLRYHISRDTFSGRLALPQNCAIPLLAICRAVFVRYHKKKQARNIDSAQVKCRP